MSAAISELAQEELLEKLEVFKIKGRDKRGRKILRIIGKFFPGKKNKLTIPVFSSLSIHARIENRWIFFIYLFILFFVFVDLVIQRGW